ncbi:hypothetical protein BHO_0900043 (plasmid) [Borrelia hermsii YBT]|uniref:Uncharacterized protein n=1 Tax=Borrelia hermsii YBT TaxID=1313295 RepID=W5T2L3_BORHE|nr:hypothetical protein BHO_0900043 [Borrelia hermsii YBT]
MPKLFEELKKINLLIVLIQDIQFDYLFNES